MFAMVDSAPQNTGTAAHGREVSSALSAHIDQCIVNIGDVKQSRAIAHTAVEVYLSRKDGSCEIRVLQRRVQGGS